MELLLISFVAGILTILAPCILPLMPVIVGGSVSETKNRWRPLIITVSMAVSIVIFTLALRASTVFIDIPVDFWRRFSGGIVIIIGLFFLFPEVWERLMLKVNLSGNKLLGKGAQTKGAGGPVIMGAALGPVFISCSPTYLFILGSVFPLSFARGTAFLISYAVGLMLIMLLVAYGGQRVIAKLGWATNPKGWFKRILGIIFIAVGLAVFTGFDKEIEAWLLDSGIYDGISDFENRLIEGSEQ